MFVQDFQIVALPYRTVVARISSDVNGLLGDALDVARTEGERLRVRVAPRVWPVLLAKAVDLRSGDLREHGDVALLPIWWEASGETSLFPKLDADLEIAPVGQDLTQLALRGRYEPPGGALGRSLDRVLLHRVAESTIRAFLSRICARVEAPTPAATT